MATFTASRPTVKPSHDRLQRRLSATSDVRLMFVLVRAGNRLASRTANAGLARLREAVFEQLAQRVRERVSRVLRSINDPHLADDVLQQVLLNLWQRADQFDPRQSF